MSIEKKSLISTLKSAKKANLASEISHDQMTRSTGTKASPMVKMGVKTVAASKAAIKTVAAKKAAIKTVAAKKLARK